MFHREQDLLLAGRGRDQFEPLPPCYREFWRAEEKRLAAGCAGVEAESTDGLVARKFHLAVAANVRRPDELAAHAAFLPWSFHREMAESIAAAFDARRRVGKGAR